MSDTDKEELPRFLSPEEQLAIERFVDIIIAVFRPLSAVVAAWSTIVAKRLYET